MIDIFVVKDNLIFNPSLCSAAGKISTDNLNFFRPSTLPNKSTSFENLKSKICLLDPLGGQMASKRLSVLSLCYNI